YLYRIVNRRAPLTLEKGRAWQVTRPLDAEAMHRAAQALVGRHDFTTFRSVHCQANDPVKTLDRLDVRREGDHVLIEAEARSFLHHQVRSMVGTLALVGLGQWREEQVAEALEARDRAALGLNAPSEGLYFVAARYPVRVRLRPRPRLRFFHHLALAIASARVDAHAVLIHGQVEGHAADVGREHRSAFADL